MPDRRKVNVAVSTVYDSLSSGAIDCAQFVVALEEGLNVLPGFSAGQFGAEDHFFVHLGFDEIDDELRALSVVVGFHAIDPLSQPSEIDYLLRQYTGHFSADDVASSAASLVETVYEEISRRVEQGWLEP
jgi:hypothetical protein